MQRVRYFVRRFAEFNHLFVIQYNSRVTPVSSTPTRMNSSCRSSRFSDISSAKTTPDGILDVWKYNRLRGRAFRMLNAQEVPREYLGNGRQGSALRTSLCDLLNGLLSNSTSAYSVSSDYRSANGFKNPLGTAGVFGIMACDSKRDHPVNYTK